MWKAGRAYSAGMATMPVQVDEDAMVRAAIEAVPLPKGVRLQSIRDDIDSVGEPAYRITMTVSGPFPLPKKRIKQLVDWNMSVLMSVRSTGTERWPIIRFKEVH